LNSAIEGLQQQCDSPRSIVNRQAGEQSAVDRGGHNVAQSHSVAVIPLHQSGKENGVIRVRQRFLLTPEPPNDDEFWQRRRHHFTDELLADLALSCAMWLGMGRMLRTLDIGQQCRITLPSRA
jgi:hypothetical protein